MSIKAFDDFRKKWITKHEEDNNKHALQWFLNEIFDDVEKLLKYAKLQNDVIGEKDE